MRLTCDASDGEPVRAWVRRPDALRVETLDGRVLHAQPGTSLASGATPDGESTLDGHDPDRRTLRAPVWWTDPTTPRPRRDRDGLVVEPMRWADALPVDDAMWVNYRWVAMLNPRELADGQDGSPALAIESLVAGVRKGRATLLATVRPLLGYDPRCGCCPLLPSCESEMAEGDPEPMGPFADAHWVALDLATGVCVAAHQIGGPHDGAGFSVTIEAVGDAYDNDWFASPAVPARGRFGRAATRERPLGAVPGLAPPDGSG